MHRERDDIVRQALPSSKFVSASEMSFHIYVRVGFFILQEGFVKRAHTYIILDLIRFISKFEIKRT